MKHTENLNMLRKEQRELNDQILKTLVDFSERTGLTVSSINVNIMDASTPENFVKGITAYRYGAVETDVKL